MLISKILQTYCNVVYGGMVYSNPIGSKSIPYLGEHYDYVSYAP